MPIIWRYLYKQFFKVFLLTTFSFVFILIVTRLKEIARFISLTPSVKYVFLFIINIIPYILPIAIPIACLLSAILLFQRLSLTHELTALRALGYSLSSIIFPILAIASILSLANFYVISELTSYSQIYSRKVINDLMTSNPFYLLENRDKLRKKDFYVDMDIQERGKVAQNLIIITPDKNNKQLCMMLINKMKIYDGTLIAPSIHMITMPPTDEENYDHLIIENGKDISSSATELTQMMHKTHLHLEPHHLAMPFLLITLNQAKTKLKTLPQQEIEQIAKTKKEISFFYSEIAKRISIGFSVFTFTLLGISFSIEIGRNKRKSPFVILFLLATFGLISFFMGKMFHHVFPLAFCVYFFPHLLCISASVTHLFRIKHGIE